MRITAAVMQKADGTLTRRRIELEEVELDNPYDDEVLIRVTSCGVCGTDKGAIHGLEPYPTPGVRPMAPTSRKPSRRLARAAPARWSAARR